MAKKRDQSTKPEKPPAGNNGQRARIPGSPRNGRNDEGGPNEYTAFLEQGDVLGLLGLVRSRSITTLTPDGMNDLMLAIRRKEKTDLAGLIETAFAEIAGLAFVMFMRASLHIERRLAECDSFGGDPTHFPADLVTEGWLDRSERIARFFMEVCSTRARILHVDGLSDRAKRKTQDARGPRPRTPLEGCTIAVGAGEEPPRNGRCYRQEERFRFP